MLLPYVYSLITMADVIAIIVADVVTTFYLYIVYGWCYCHTCVADVIATEADVIAYHICISWLMFLPRRWQILLPLRLMLLPTIYIFYLADVIAKIVADVIATMLNVLADGIAKWQMEWPL